MKSTGQVLRAALIVAFSLSMASGAGAEMVVASQPAASLKQPMNHLVLMLDCSGSYRKRQAEAIQKTVELIDAMAQSELHRWESGTDRVTMISIDAIPEVIWEGDLRALKALKPEEWQERLKGRADYAQCTDVVEAFKLAVKTLGEESPMLSRFLLIFSDLQAEPPLDSITESAPPVPVSEYPADFPWEELRGISVAAFWVPKEGKFEWTRAKREHGLEESFRIYTESEAASVQLQPPPKAKENVSVEVKQERAQTQLSTYVNVIGRFAKVIGGVFVGTAIVFGIAALVAKFFPRRRPRRPMQPRRRTMNGRPAGMRPSPVPVRRSATPPPPQRR